MTTSQIKRWIKHPTRLIAATIARFGKRLPDALYLYFRYYDVFGKKLNLKNPKTFNEKLQWLKLYDREPEYTIMVDKIEAKKWVASKIGEEYIIPTLGVWERAEDIDFDTLPDQFVLKTNHDSGRVIICTDKSRQDYAKIRKEMKISLKRNYYLQGREWPYKNVTPKILAEKMLVTESINGNADIPDYKFMCFNGKVEYIFIVSERKSNQGMKVTFFDREWNKLSFTRHYPASDRELSKPQNFETMIRLAERLSSGIRFLRVDFYENQNQIFFGELTFYPGSGFEEFSPEEWDYKMGELINLY